LFFTGMRDFVENDETADVLCNEQLTIIQKKRGYRFSIDAILLASFVRLKRHERLLDIGSGCGIIPIYMARKGYANDMTGIELQKGLFDAAQKNRVINLCEHHVRFINADIMDVLEDMKKDHFQVIVANPPYTKRRSGRICPEESRLLARYEEKLDIESLTAAVSKLLSRKGRFYAIYPARRLAELVSAAQSKKLALKKLRVVYPRQAEEANLILTEFLKEGGPGVTIEKPLYVYNGSTLSDEVKKYYSFED
jgi:tRNA1Val (adenine37-N6)-methyltransferase